MAIPPEATSTIPCDLPCPGCQYNLRGLPARVCPECGLVLTPELLRAALQRTRPRGWSRAHSLVGALFAVAAVATSLVIARDSASAGDFAFLAVLCVAPFVPTFGVFVMLAHFARRSESVATGCAMVAGVVIMHWIAWGPYYHKIAGAPLAGFILVPLYALVAGLILGTVGLTLAMVATRLMEERRPC